MANDVLEAMRDGVAAAAHDAWCGWMRYLFSKCATLDTGELVIPADLVERWRREMNTPYRQLPENERQSDRTEADRYIRAMFV